MPTRHGINNTARGYHTYAEIQKMGYGTQKVRYGKDSQIKFGHCCLSLQAAKDPVVSPSGHMYSKDAIYKYLLTKVKELKRARRLYDKQQAELEASGAGQEAIKTREKFMLLQDRVCDSKSTTSASAGFKTSKGGKDKGTIDGASRKRLIEHLGRDFDTETRASKRQHLSKTNYWLPDFTPTAAPSLLKKPPKRPKSPMSGAPLRVKHLIPVTLTKDPENPKRVICPVSKKTISTQPAVLIKSTGHVVLESVFKQITQANGSSDVAGPQMLSCPVTGEQITPDDVIPLIAGGSSFASSGKVEATKWNPMI